MESKLVNNLVKLWFVNITFEMSNNCFVFALLQSIIIINVINEFHVGIKNHEYME